MKVGLLYNMWIRAVASIAQVPTDVVACRIPMIEPFPRSFEQWNLQRKVDDILLQQDAWQDGDAKHHLPLIPEKESQVQEILSIRQHYSIMDQDDGDHPALTYGEITPLGARQLFHYMGLSSSSSSPDTPFAGRRRPHRRHCSFYDLGSGHGKLAIQAYLELSSSHDAPLIMDQVVGIELVKRRHDCAIRAWNKIQQQQQLLLQDDDDLSNHHHDSTLQFIHGNVFDIDLRNATHIYCSSLCFSKEMMKLLTYKLLKNNADEQQQQQQSQLQCLATLQPLVVGGGGGMSSSTIPKARKEYIQMSWTKPCGCPVYIYDFMKKMNKEREAGKRMSLNSFFWN